VTRKEADEVIQILHEAMASSFHNGLVVGACVATALGCVTHVLLHYLL